MRLRQYSNYTWKTADGRALVLKDIEDDHLRNIIRKIIRYSSKPAPEPLVREYIRRGLQPSIDDLKKNIKKQPTYTQLLERVKTLEEKLERIEKLLEV
jgi:hypothetical protein